MDLAKLEQEINLAKEEKKKLETEVADLHKDKMKAIKEIGDLNRLIRSLTNQRDMLSKKVVEVQADIKQKLADFQVQVIKAKGYIKTAEELKVDLKAQFDELLKQKQLVQQREAINKDNSRKHTAKLMEFEREKGNLNIRKKDMEFLEANIEKLRQEIIEAEKRIDLKNQELMDNLKIFNEAKAKLETLKKAAIEHEERLKETQQVMEAKNKQLDGLIAEYEEKIKEAEKAKQDAERAKLVSEKQLADLDTKANELEIKELQVNKLIKQHNLKEELEALKKG